MRAQLAGAFVVEAVVWGFPNAFGLFLEAYLSDPKFASQPHAASLLPLIGPLSSGIIYCSGPVIYPFASRYPHHRRTSMWVGTLFCWTSLFGASYATKKRTGGATHCVARRVVRHRRVPVVRAMHILHVWMVRQASWARKRCYLRRFVLRLYLSACGTGIVQHNSNYRDRSRRPPPPPDSPYSIPPLRACAYPAIHVHIRPCVPSVGASVHQAPVA